LRLRDLWNRAIYCNSGNMSLSELILQTRKRAKLTRQELAALAGVGKTVVWDLEHGKRTVRLETLLKVLAVLNISLVVRSPIISEEFAL
jgi:HTH-type transcriptional regulator / antitoxin HipB